MKTYCLNNFFRVYSCKYIPIKYITKNKESDVLENACFAELIARLENGDFINDLSGIYIAVTHDLLVKRLKENERVKLYKVSLPGKENINNLKQYLFYKCKNCNKTCKMRKMKDLISDKVQEYFIFFVVE